MSYTHTLVITPEKKALIEEQKFKCIRDNTGKLLNVSYTEEGLKWTFDKFGRPLYYSFPETVFTNYGYLNARFVGTMQINPNITIEDYSPTNHFDSKDRLIIHKQKAEVLYCDKALRLMFPMNGGNIESLEAATNRIKEAQLTKA
jgi:hypothetical protein